MSLKNLCKIHSGLNLVFILLALFAFSLIGCGEMEEVTTEESQSEAAEPQEARDEKPMDQALTSFVGSDVEEREELPATPPPPPPPSPTQLSQYEKQIDDLRTENTGLKQKIVKLEQENRSINARITEAEAKYAAEKLRADKAEEMKSTPQMPKVEKPQPSAALPGSASTYESALRSFKARRYGDAEEGFRAVAEGSDDAVLANQATYWLGETYYAKKNYKEALSHFQETIKFKNSRKKADAQFMIAQTYERLGSRAKAKAAYEKVVKNYPMSRLVKRAKARWAKL